MTAAFFAAPCNNAWVAATATEKGKSFDEVLEWFGLRGDDPDWNDPNTASGPGVATAKKWWRAATFKNPAPDNDRPYGFSYVDVMLDVVFDIQKRYDTDPAFAIVHIPTYCNMAIKDHTFAMKEAFEGGPRKPFKNVTELPDLEGNPQADENAAPAKEVATKFATRDEDESLLQRLAEDAFLTALRRALSQHADNLQDLQAALMFINLLNDLDDIDLDDVPINPRGATRDQLLEKQAIYLTSSPEEQVLLETGSPETRSRRFKRRITTLDELIATAYASIDEGDVS